MMASVAHRAMTSDLWGTLALSLIALFCAVSIYQTWRHIIGGGPSDFAGRLRRRAALCLDRSGYIGAVLARHTVLVTLNIVALNMSLALLSTVRALDGGTMSAPVLEWCLMALATVCGIVVLIIAVMTFALCNEVVRQAENS